MTPLCVVLYAGLHGWEEGFVSEGYWCVGFDIVDMCATLGHTRPPNVNLVIQDVTTLHGSQFKDAAAIVASPPCQEYSYMAMPWSRAKEKIRQYESGELDVKDLTRLFDACFRIQHEAIEARMAECPDCSGPEGWPNAPCRKCHIPLIVENVRGAQRWVGQAKWHFGSYYLWGDVPALMPITFAQRMKFKVDCSPQLWRDRVAASAEDAAASGHLALSQVKVPGQDWNKFRKSGQVSPHWRMEGVKQAGISGPRNNGKGAATFGSQSNQRRAAAAAIAKIPFPLAQHIARVFYPGASSEYTAPSSPEALHSDSCEPPSTPG